MGDKKDEKVITTKSGHKYIDVKVGDGKEAKAGDSITVHYTGTFKDGKKFDSSVGKAPFPFTLGKGQVIKGWDEGVAGMKREGGKRKLIIPSDLAYGPDGRQPGHSAQLGAAFRRGVVEGEVKRGVRPGSG